MEDKARCCQSCKARCAGNFKKVVDLQYSGLVIYLHTKKDEQKNAGASKIYDTFILHNTGSKEIKGSDFVTELHRFKSECGQCNTIVQRVRSLLVEIRAIRENEIIGVCEHCKRTNPNKTCKRCELIVSKFISLHQKECEEKQQRFKIWLCKVKQLLEAILVGESVCQHRLYKDTELERILRELKAPLTMREPDINFFPSLDPDCLSESKIMLEELLSKIKKEGEKHSSLDETMIIPPSHYDAALSGDSKDLSRLLSQEAYKELIKRLLDLSKALPQGLYLNRELIQQIIETLNTAINQGLSTDIIVKLIKELKELDKILTHDLSENLNKKVVHGLIHDLNDLLIPGSSKYLNRDLIQLLIDLSESLTNELSKVPQEENIGSSQVKETRLPKDTTNKVKTQAPFKDLIKASKDSKPVSSSVGSKETTQTSCKYTTNQLIQKVANLKKTLAGESLNKCLIQELSSDINKTLGQTSPNLMNKIILELTDLCKPAVKGIPKSANMQLIQDLLKNTSTALTQGLSKEHNKKNIQGLLNDLNKALRDGSKEHSYKEQQLFKGKKEGTSKESKELRSGLLSKALIPLSREISKNRLKDLSKQKPKYGEDATKRRKEFESEEDISKKTTKSGKSSSKNKSLVEELKSKHGDRIDKAVSESEKDRKHRKMEKSSKKTRMELKGKTTFSFGDDDDSLLYNNKAKTKDGKGSSIKKPLMEKTRQTKALKMKKEKENLSTGDEKSAKKLMPKQLSETALLNLLREKALSLEKFKLHKQRQEEIERRRLRQLLAMKTLPLEKKKEEPPTPPEEMSDSILQCNIQKTRAPKLMVRGETISPYDPRYKDKEYEVTEKPLLFKTQLEFTDDTTVGRKPEGSEIIDYERMFQDAVVRYRLSSKEFIDNGWTQLPTQRTMRRMNIYKMKPASPQYDWFARHKQDKELFYDNGNKLADIDEDGRGHWYYRNGAVALDYYNAQDSSIGQRYVVYSSGEEMENGRLKPRTILALFDVRGNGVVYDHFGNVRLKYNQSEGILVDPKLGPPGKWKWHTLNDPPVLQQVFTNTYMKKRDPNLDLVQKPANTRDAANIAKEADPQMLAIELDNYAKEKTNKLLQKFKPFQIRMKAVKLNGHFSLKILDQANIYLLYRDGVTRLKLNLGMLLISNEIIDTDTSDIADVATPYDKLPPKSHSVENIQNILKTVKM